MNEMVERVAEALAGRQWTSMEDGNVYCSNPTKYHYREQARAAIAAMREPTNAMVDAGQKPPRAPFRYMAEASLRLRWLAMIDAALN